MNKNRYSLNVYSIRVNESSPLLSGEKINRPDRACQILSEYFSKHRDDREHIVALALTHKLAVIGIVKVAEGGASTAHVDPKVLFRTLLTMGACKFILAHNHPSGDPTPSPEDLNLTKRIGEGGDLLGLQCLDHVIFGDGTNKVISLTETEQFSFSPLKHWGEEKAGEHEG